MSLKHPHDDARDLRTAARWLRCYPAAWRKRYGEELKDLILATSGEGGVPWRTRADLLRSGAFERLRNFGLGGDSPAADQVRAGALIVLCAWAIFLVGGFTLQRFAENWSTLRPDTAVTTAQAAFVAVQALAPLAGLIVLLGIAAALPSVLALLRAGRWREIRQPILRAIPFTLAAIVSFAVIAVWARQLDGPQRNGHDAAYAAGFVAMVLICCACLATWTIAAVSVARRIELTSILLRLQAALAAAASFAMLAITLATGIWWATLASNAPWILHGQNAGGSTSPITPPLLVAGALMAFATALASFGAIWALRALPALRKQYPAAS